VGKIARYTDMALYMNTQEVKQAPHASGSQMTDQHQTANIYLNVTGLWQLCAH